VTLKVLVKAFDFILGLLLGTAVGYAVALLFAPRSGAETQEMLRQQVEIVLKEGRRAAEDKREQLEARLEALKKPPKSAPTS
jgi:gas vesicle protein